MKKIKIIAILLFSFGMSGTVPAQAVQEQYDVVIYGATSAGITAAVAAKKSGVSVILLSPEKHIGGLTTSGLGYTDIGNQHGQKTIGGLTEDFFHQIRVFYQNSGVWRYQTFEGYQKKIANSSYRINDSLMWTFEPHVAEKVFNDLLKENKIPLRLNEWLDRSHGVMMQDGNIASVRMLNGDSYRAKVFIDATYEGDLMAAAGVSYTIGRESNNQYGETINGIETAMAIKNNLPGGIDPYVRQGNPQAVCCRGSMPARVEKMAWAIKRYRPIVTGYALLMHQATG